MTPQELDAMLRAAKGPSGGPFDLDAFKRGLKYEELFEELENREIVFSITDEGRPFLFRISIWMFLWHRHDDLWFAECHRTRNGHRLKREIYGQAGTETLMRGESQSQAAIRGYRQEFDLEVDSRALDFNKLAKVFHRQIVRESSVYAGFISGSYVYPVVADLVELGYPERPWKEGRTGDDCGTAIRCEWRHIPELTRLVTHPDAAIDLAKVVIQQPSYREFPSDEMVLPPLR